MLWFEINIWIHLVYNLTQPYKITYSLNIPIFQSYIRLPRHAHKRTNGNKFGSLFEHIYKNTYLKQL